VFIILLNVSAKMPPRREYQFVRLLSLYREMEIEWQFQSNKNRLPDQMEDEINQYFRHLQNSINEANNLKSRKKCYKLCFELSMKLYLANIYLNYE
jgi:glucosamine 6-phosphate synthetase-like amidotransferase/phosphosugar isomerase protein